MSKGAVILVNAVIWGAVIIACALALKGTGLYKEIQLYLWGGAILTNLILGGTARKKQEETDNPVERPQ